MPIVDHLAEAAALLDYAQHELTKLDTPLACMSEHHEPNDDPTVQHGGPGHYWLIFNHCEHDVVLRCRPYVEGLTAEIAKKWIQCINCGWLARSLAEYCTIIGTVDD